MRFWRERERDNKEHIFAPLCGQIRILVVGDSGVGKSSLVHLIVKGSSIVRPSQTIGCTVGVKAAKEARYDKEALNKIFRMLISRRYFSDELPSSSSAWSLSPAPSQQVDEGTSDEDQFYKRASLKGGDPYKYNTLPPHNLPQPPGLYPQQPPDRYNYAIPRFSLSSVEETNNGNARSKRMDINVCN